MKISEMPPSNRKRDRSFWILFCAGWTVYGGLMVLTALVEGRPVFSRVLTVLPPAVISILIAANRRFFIFGEKSPTQLWTEHGEYRYVGMMIDLRQLFAEWLSIGALTAAAILIAGLRREA